MAKYEIPSELLVKITRLLDAALGDELTRCEVRSWTRSKRSHRKSDEPKGKDGRTGYIVDCFVKAWSDGKTALTHQEFREKVRSVKYFATDQEARAALKKSPKQIKENSDGTFSLVKVPLKLVG